MSRFFVTLEVSATFSITAPTLEVLVDGVVQSSVSVTAQTGLGTNIFNFDFDFSGSYPSSLSFRFNDGSGEVGRTVTIENSYVNGQLVDNSYLSMLVLMNTQSSAVNVAAIDYFFGRVEPVALPTPDIVGTPSADRIYAYSTRTIIEAGGGNDAVIGQGANDIISGGAGNDRLNGGGGNDILTGGADDDIIYGGLGDDLIYGGTGDDILLGEAGNDVINGGDGADALIGDAGNDVLYGEAGNDILIGDAGADWLYGDAGVDRMDGGTGNDTMYGGADGDFMSGNANNDTMYGESGDDSMDGGGGNDTMDGGAGSDRLIGGAGNDTISGGTENDYLLGDAGTDTLNGDAGNDVLIGGTGADTLNGGADNDRLYGHALSATTASAIVVANPTVSYNLATNSFYMLVNSAVNFATASSTAQTTLLNGVAGRLVTITSGEENAFVLSLASGNTVWMGASDADTEGVWQWTAGTESNSQFSNGATATNGFFINWDPAEPNNTGNSDYAVLETNGLWYDRLAADTYRYVIEWEGSLYDEDNAIDTLNGGTGNDDLMGGGGNDVLNGNDGNDKIWGGTGNDTIDGGNNDDFLVGGAGADTITGSAGNDTINLVNGDFAATESIDGGTGTDVIILGNATTVDFTTGTLAGIETLTGSGGDDNVTILITHATTTGMFTTINLGTGTDGLTLRVSGANDISAVTLSTLTNIENGFIAGSAVDDTLTITGAQLNSILAGTGTIDMGGGAADTLVLTSTSSDFNTLGATDASITGLEVITVSGSPTITITLSGQTEGFTVNGGGGNDTITGGSGADIIAGGNGNNTITGGGGADTITTGTGTDTINLANGDFAATESIDGGTGTDSIVLTNATTVDLTTGTLAGIETLTGSGGNDDVTVYLSQAITVATGGMFNTINLGSGTDSLSLRVNGTNNIAAATLATLTSVENGSILGSTGDDILTLTAAQFNAIIAGTGVLDMGGGTGDTINLNATTADLNTLGSGSDANISGLEIISFSTAGAGVTLDLSLQTEGFTVTGGASADTITLGAGDDVIASGGGVDIIDAGEGTNTINIANGDFTGAESITGGGGTDTIVLTNATTVNFTTGTLTDIDNITGSTGNDTVTIAAAGLAAFLSIDLSGGTDIFNAYIVGSVDISADTIATFSNIETGNITGSGGNNDIITLTAAQLDALLIGATATINLGAGTGDAVNFDGTSADLNTAGATDAYIAGVEAFSFAAATAGVTLTLSGQTEGFTITTGAYADTVTGGGGNDTINLANNDFDAGESLTGGGGTDTIVLTNGTTVDFTTGTLATIETLTGSGSADTVTMLATHAAGMFTTISLGGGTDNIYIKVDGAMDISAATLATITAENGYVIGTTLDDTFTLTGAQLNGILAGSGTVDLGAGEDTIILTSTSSEFNTLGATDASIQGIETITVSGSPAITITLSAQTEDLTINGGGGVDTITGGRGNTTIYGNAGNDVITSSSQDTLAAQATEITTTYSGVTYNATTGSFYRYVNSAVTWTTANTAATADVINGVAGHLVQINNTAENSAIDTLGGANPVWIGVSDETTEGTFLMIGGPMNSIIMRSGGAQQNGIYANWAAGNPNASAANDDYIRQENGGTWTDQVAATTSRYVIEWEGSQLLSAETTTIINGGTGNDTITLGSGQDYVILADWGAANADTINSYDRTDLDQIDISALLTGYVEGTSDPDAFARLTVSGADLLLQIDQNGSVGGASFTTMATLVGLGTSGLNIEEMVANNLLIMTPAPGINFYFDWGAGNYNYNSTAIGTTVFKDTDIGSGISGNDMFSINRTVSDVTLDYLNAGAPGILVVTGSSKADDITISGIVSSVAMTVALGGGNDTLVITAAGNAVVTGDAGNDTITTGDGNDTITGGAGADTMDGGAGNDTFNIATGWTAGESITGGAGTDDAIVLTAAATIDFSTGTLNTLERLTGFAGGNDTITLTAAQWAMFTTIDLISGTDVVNVLASGDISSAGTPTVSNVDTGNLIGTTGDDTVTMTGTQLNAILIGAGTINFQGGTADTMNLTSTSTDLNGLNDASVQGLEIISAASAGGAVTITLSTQTEGFTVTGGTSGDTITGGSGGDTIDGGAGTGSDTLNGNGGTDTVSYASASAGVTVSLALQGAGQNTVNAGTDNLSNFENLTGSAFADTLTGDGNANTIRGGLGNDNIYGGGNNDILYGDGGSDNLYGEAGNDSLYSGSVDTLASQISAILAANPSLTYNSTTGSFYQFVNTTVTWTAANTAAAAAVVGGIAGHLIHINNAAENTVADGFSGNSIWIGVNDATTEGTFQFVGGLMNGIVVRSGGTAQNNLYQNWAGGNPGGSSADDDYIRQRNGGNWLDGTSTNTYRYVIEWEGSRLLTPTESTTLSGGAGTDTLYGSAGQDIFLFEAATWGTNDVISGYDRTDIDKIDIGDLLTGYTAGVSDVDAFARFTVSGADLLLQVDQNGATGGASYSTIATLSGLGTSGLNVEEMVAHGMLIMT